MRFAIVLLAAVACSGPANDSSDDSDGTTDTSGTAAPANLILSFDLDADLIPTMEEPAVGVFHGSVFAEADASAIGPVDGATSLLDFDSPELDFGTAGGVLADRITVGPVDAQVIWILGCFDADANDCDKGDPITVPNENKLQATPGDGHYTVVMSLLNPS